MANPTTSGTAYNVITTLRYVFNSDEEKVFDYMNKLDKPTSTSTPSPARRPARASPSARSPWLSATPTTRSSLRSEGADVTITDPRRGHRFRDRLHVPREGRARRRQRQEALRLDPGCQAAQAIIAKWYVVPLSKLATKNPVAFSMDRGEDGQAGSGVGFRATRSPPARAAGSKEIGSKR